MAFTSALPSGMLIIDDSNAHQFIQDAAKIGEFGSGYVQRDFERVPIGSVKPLTRKRPYPRSEWAERIKDKEKRREGNADFHRAMKIPVLNQSQLGYCWMYGPVAAMQVGYYRFGTPVHLSASYTASKTTGYRNRGGTATEALQGIDRFGVPTIDFHPEHTMDRRYDTPEIQNNASLHKTVQWEELPSQSFADLITALIDDDPTTLGLAWWGHLIAALQARVLGNNAFGVEFVNSWDYSFGKQGFGILEESKAIAFEQYVIRGITPSGGV